MGQRERGASTLSQVAEQLPDEGGLVVYDVSLIPDEPAPELIYRHRPELLRSARELLRRAEVILTLTERDIKAQYKQQVLGIGWALLTPLINLFFLTVVFRHVRATEVGGHVPFILYAYVGLLTWGLFGGAIGGGSNSLVSNKSLMAKSHFPRECFPMSQILGSTFTSLMGLAPLVILFAVESRAPRLATLWVPLYLTVEIMFTAGIVLAVAAIIVQMRDLQQVLPIVIPLAMLATVLIPFSKLTHQHFGPNAAYFVHGWVRSLYCVVNPLVPLIDSVRGSVLFGVGPSWHELVLATIGSFGYLVGGYALFKKLEVNFADLS